MVQPQLQSSDADIWKWTLTNEATAPCFVEDVFAMQDNARKDGDFFWLKSVPCRNVKLVGMVVGVAEWEKRIVYSIDDGTGVIDCFQRHQVPPPSPKKARPTKEKTAAACHEPPVLPVPLAAVGDSVRIVGKVTRWHDSKQIAVEHIEICQSLNEEPLHWRTVLALHESSYSRPGPFVVPSHSAVLDAPHSSTVPGTRNVAEPSSPTARQRDLPPTASASSTPSASSSAASSPSKPIRNSPPKLRHPSRLHSRDLTANTFRIYVKHYMDNAPSDFYHDADSDVESDDHISYSLSRAPLTPTKSNSRQSQALTQHEPNIQTPRPSRNTPNLDQTPRASKAPTPPSTNRNCLRGFTLSYLRRVPELADMARRVVKAEAKRRARDERKRAPTQDKSMRSKVELPPSAMAQKMKRLFSSVIVKLYEEGSIVIWDGPARRWAVEEASALWKTNSSTVSADSTIFSAAGVSRDEDDSDLIAGYLSDPQPGEESYIPLTPAYLSSHVESAITAMISRAERAASASTSRKYAAAPPPGPTKDEITQYMRRTDERWARVGEWAVGDALEALRKVGRVWCIAGGRWELCS
ncbi:hypothetical protein PLICRDRAFT_112232 [Plicaturopsis crispa FD-325 SS-3]|nr:hypothetical protein PLICRDRAFT_112232 [Plicaturopsis crispa FD-325 SS-3]